MSSTTPNKIKILITGEIGENVTDFVSKLTSLNKSKAGPFHACFCVGRVDASQIISASEQFPMPVYLQDSSGLTEEEGLVEIKPNLYTFATAQVVPIEINSTQLVVASCPPRLQWDTKASKQMQETLSHVSYVGCDLLLSSEWPQGVEQTFQNETVSSDEGSYDIAQVALHARPRYHFAPAHGKFIQSLPFKHLAASSSTFTPKHTGRFLSLCPVVSAAEFKKLGKSHKFVHALGITPLQYMTAQELTMPEGVLPNPYTDSSYQTTTSTSALANNANTAGLSEAQARRLLSESSSATGDSHTRWASKKRSRDNDDGNGDVDNSTNTVLFLHGLHKDVTGKLQTASAALLEAFSKYKVERIQRPPGTSSYAFLEFPTHELAEQCLQESGGETTVGGIHLTLKWATNKNSNKREAPKKRRLLEADAMDSSTVFYKLPNDILKTEVPQTSEDLRKFMETTLERALADPNVTAENEPALQVKVRPVQDRDYGFLEFASHAAASMVLATLTGSTDGGLTRGGASNELEIPHHLSGVGLHWAQNQQKPASTENDGGLKFQRKHFPADSRKDCWFCLASPTCEKHLVVSVHDECYIAMPKGPVHKGHALIVPVTHSSKGALVDRSVAREVDLLTERLRQHASDVYGMDLFVFERAIQTKGGYHTHVQCIPIERGLGMKLQATMIALAKSTPKFDLKELNSDLALAAMASDDDDEDSGGYFYAQVPISSKETKRFLYKAPANGGGAVPLQFGREVLAQVMDNPDLAHWKACVEDEEKETALTAAFRESFAPFAPSE